MDWLNKLGKPFFPTREDAATYITGELQRSLPADWKVTFSSDDRLAWTIEKTQLQPGEWPNKSYSLRLSVGLDFLIFTYGNCDKGPFSLYHAFHNAMVIETVMLRRFGLVECLNHVLSHCKPNEWGYT